MPAARKIIQVLNGESVFPPPVWLMRQAGRYLPEYREVRQRAKSFLDLCYSPELASEVTLQPIRRFGFDAAILFSDILVVPDALGRDVRFVEGEGPRMAPLEPEDVPRLEEGPAAAHLAPVIETVRRVRRELPEETTLLGFCGAPWTVATYMIAGRGTVDQAPARLFAYRHPEAFARLLELLADVSADYLVGADRGGRGRGADLRLLGGSAGRSRSSLHYAVQPVRRMVERIRARVPDARIIAFAKGAGLLLKDYRAATGASGIGLDWTVPLGFARELQRRVRCRAISIRCALWRAAGRSTRGWTGSSAASATGR